MQSAVCSLQSANVIHRLLLAFYIFVPNILFEKNILICISDILRISV